MDSYKEIALASILVSGLLYIGVSAYRKKEQVSRLELEMQVQSETSIVGDPLSLSAAMNKLISGKKTPAPAIYSGNRADIDRLKGTVFSKNQLKESDTYFKKLVSHGVPMKFYKRAQAVWGTDPAADGAARWATLGLVFDSSATYGETLSLALKNANESAQEIFSKTLTGMPEIRKSPFFYQSAMNLVPRLDVSLEDQVRYFGGEMEYQLLNTVGDGKDSFWIGVLGLKLAQQAGVRGPQIEPYIQKGLRESRLSAQTRADFIRTAKHYFKDLEL